MMRCERTVALSDFWNKYITRIPRQLTKKPIINAILIWKHMDFAIIAPIPIPLEANKTWPDPVDSLTGVYMLDAIACGKVRKSE